MIGALAAGFIELAKRPLLFVPALIAMALNVLVLLFTIDNYFNFFFGVFLLGEVPDVSIAELPYYLFTAYWQDVIVMAAAAFVTFFISLWLLYTYADLVGKKGRGVLSQVLAQAKRAPEIFGLTISTFIGFFLYTTVAFLLFIGTVSLGDIGIIAFILFLAWLVFGIYSFFKFAFTPLFMAIERKNIKSALAESWKWTGKRLLSVIALFVAVGIVSGAINLIFSLASDATAVDELAIIALVLGSAFSTAYYNIVLIKYFTDA